MRHVLLLIGLLTTTSLASAQGPSPAEDAALQAELHKRTAQAIERADRAAAAGVRIEAPQLDALPVPQIDHIPIDVEALARQFEGASRMPATAQPTLLAFVSFSMPRGSLERMIADAERTGATLISRGLHQGSLRETMRLAMELIGQRKIAWALDPEQFARFEVTTVPTYVLLAAGVEPQGCGDRVCVGEDDYVRLTGDVPIAYALERIAEHAPQFQPAVQFFVGRAQ